MNFFFKRRITRTISIAPSLNQLTSLPINQKASQMGFTEISSTLGWFFDVFRRVSLDVIETDSDLLGFHGFYWVLLGFTGFYRVLLGFTGFY